MEKIKDTIFIAVSAIFFILLGSVVAGKYLERRQSNSDEFYKKELEENYIFDHSQIKDTTKVIK